MRWSCSGQASDLSLGWDGDTLRGNLNVENTGGRVLELCSPVVGETVEVNILGDLNLSGGILAVHSSEEGGAVVVVKHGGNVNISGGEFRLSGGSQGGTGMTVWELTSGNFNILDARISSSTTTLFGARFLFSKAGTRALSIGAGNTILALPVDVSSGTTLSMGASELKGSGQFVLDSGATLEIGHANGIDGNIQTEGVKILSKLANFTYNGSVSQVTGSLLPDTVNNLTLNNSLGLTLSKDVVVEGVMDVKRGSLVSGGKKLSYGSFGSLKYSGSVSQTTGGVEFPEVEGPKDLIIANSFGVTLHASRWIRGNLSLSGKLVLGSNTLTAGSVTTGSVTTMYVNTDGGGKLRLPVGSEEVLYPIGASGSSTVSYCPVWIRNGGAVDTISVGAVKDTMYKSTKPRITLKWEISGSVGGDEYFVRFGWNPSSTLHENSLFKANRMDYARIFLVGGGDTLEAGSGDYVMQFSSSPYTVERGGIVELGSFVVGRFKDSVWMAGVKEGGGSNSPCRYSLSQNYPNPFNAVTTIAYEVASAEQVTLIIYNTLGQEVARLVNERKSAGRYEVRWDASNMPTGVYFYRLTAGKFISTKKLMLIK